MSNTLLPFSWLADKDLTVVCDSLTIGGHPLVGSTQINSVV